MRSKVNLSLSPGQLEESSIAHLKLRCGGCLLAERCPAEQSFTEGKEAIYSSNPQSAPKQQRSFWTMKRGAITLRARNIALHSGYDNQSRLAEAIVRTLFSGAISRTGQ